MPMLPPQKGQPQQLSSPTPSGIQFPPNIAQEIPEAVMTKMIGWLYNEYVLPMLMERLPYESLWDLLLNMYKLKLTTDQLRLPITQAKNNTTDHMAENMRREGSYKAQVSDTVVYDAVDRLKNLNHFISWKDGSPIKFEVPRNIPLQKDNEFYFPVATKFQQYNALLDWNIKNQNVYQKSLVVAQHHYLYGMSFVCSDLVYEATSVKRQMNSGQIIEQQEVTDIGVTFEPMSIRRIWLNYRIPLSEMKAQACPFYFEQTPQFAIMQNVYDPIQNPFGFVNLDKLHNGIWMFSQPEMDAARKALQERLEASSGSGGVNGTTNYQANNLTEILKPERSVQALWTFHPMLPLIRDPALQNDPETKGFCFLTHPKTQEPIPFKRYIWQSYANQISSGEILPVRLQENFYPNVDLPIYGSQHMPDLDSGLYSPAIGEILENHYKEICTAANQYLDNKNLINNPPSKCVIGSPAANQDHNEPGAQIKVTSQNDVDWRKVYDGTGTTAAFITLLRDQAQTTSKAVDAILGKALGGRTSATEASNVFQAAMSGVTTDINIFNHDIMGGYADRIWKYTGLWFSADILKQITGQYGTPLEPEDLWAKVDLKWDIGSTYIESIVKQQNLRYIQQASANSPVIDQATIWRQLFIEWRMPEAIEAIRDGGFAEQVEESTEQALMTYLDKPFVLDPAQDPNIAIEVKTRFLKDLDSTWNKEFASLPSSTPNQQGKVQSRAQYLQMQIEIHQQFALLQMQQQIAQQQLQIQTQEKMQMQKGGGQPDTSSGQPPSSAGQVAQQSQPQTP